MEPLLRIFLNKMGPMSKDFWWKVTHLGGTFPYALSCESPPHPGINLSQIERGGEIARVVMRDNVHNPFMNKRLLCRYCYKRSLSLRKWYQIILNRCFVFSYFFSKYLSKENFEIFQILENILLSLLPFKHSLNIEN